MLLFYFKAVPGIICDVFSHLSSSSSPVKVNDKDRVEAEDSDTSSSSLPSLEEDGEAGEMKPKQEENTKKKSVPKKSSQMSESKAKGGKVNNDAAVFTTNCVYFLLLDFTYQV